MYLDSKNNLILKGDPFRLKYTVVQSNKYKKFNNIIISSTKPNILEVTGQFIFTQNTFNIAPSGFLYESEDQLLRILLTGGATGLLTQYGVSPSYNIPVEWIDVDENVIHTMHQQPVFITGAITGGV